MLWLYITIFAVMFQTGRNTLQKHLKGKLDTISVSWARVFFILPILLFGLVYLYSNNTEIFSNLTVIFYIFCLLAGLSQILGTLCLVELFAHRNFAVGVAYMKTDTIQVAILAFLFLGESLPFVAILAVLLGVIGILMLSPRGLNLSLFKQVFHKSVLLGLGVGLFLSISTIFMKKAMFLIGSDGLVLPVAIVFAVYTVMQNILYIGYTTYHKILPQTMKLMFKEWKLCILVGICSLLGTLCWLGAFYLQSVAYVKVVAQLEILLSFIITHKFFKEHLKTHEIYGILLLIASIIVIIIEL
ncbi:MAG: drug/metabolite transporter (DMT)-like permease [Candidatus Deianiraeaceae bacterium]|jgi:drug/metabolite transporter (DMT)-like permease